MAAPRYWYVEYYHPETFRQGLYGPDHNAIVSSFDEFAALAQGRVAIITGEATEQAYFDQQMDSLQSTINAAVAQLGASKE